MSVSRARGPCVLSLALIVLAACDGKARDGVDAQVTTRGTIEITAELLEFPETVEILAKYTYDFALVMKYRVLEVHRGELDSDVVYVGHYNPLKPRPEAADGRIGDIGGDLDQFRVGDLHRLAMEVPIEDYCMAGIINKYFDQEIGPVYWAVWTNRVVK